MCYSRKCHQVFRVNMKESSERENGSKPRTTCVYEVMRALDRAGKEMRCGTSIRGISTLLPLECTELLLTLLLLRGPSYIRATCRRNKRIGRSKKVKSKEQFRKGYGVRRRIH
jgi:hypothetical protein